MKSNIDKTYKFIYKTTNLINGKFYIGMHITDDLNDGYLGSGKVLRRAIRKHGKENFIREILEFYETQDLLAEAERKIVTRDLILDPMCMNLMEGGYGGFISDEQQKHRAICAGRAFAEKLKTDPVFREQNAKRVGEIMKQNHKLGKIKYDTFTGKSHTAETKLKIGNANRIRQIGENNSQFGTCWITKDKIK